MFFLSNSVQFHYSCTTTIKYTNSHLFLKKLHTIIRNKGLKGLVQGTETSYTRQAVQCSKLLMYFWCVVFVALFLASSISVPHVLVVQWCAFWESNVFSLVNCLVSCQCTPIQVYIERLLCFWIPDEDRNGLNVACQSLNKVWKHCEGVLSFFKARDTVMWSQTVRKKGLRIAIKNWRYEQSLATCNGPIYSHLTFYTSLTHKHLRNLRSVLSRYKLIISYVYAFLIGWSLFVMSIIRKCIFFVLLSLNILSEKEELTQGAPFKQQSEANQSNAYRRPYPPDFPHFLVNSGSLAKS